MAFRVSTVEIDLPDDFPNLPYDAIQARVATTARHADQVFHFGGAWNAVVYRFLSCTNSDRRFTELVAAGTAPGQPQRFHQEAALFNFFVNGLSVIESFFYGLYWLGSMADEGSFPILPADKLRGIKPDQTMTLFERGRYSHLFAAAFARLRTPVQTGNYQNRPEYDEWKDVRNILAHRASYGRIINLSGGGGRQLDDKWQVRDIPINQHLTSTRRAWLAATLRSLLEGAEAFADQSL